MVEVSLHSTFDASRPAPLLLRRLDRVATRLDIFPIFSLVAPGRRAASPVLVRRGTFTRGV
jgi:hypothetical protein